MKKAFRFITMFVVPVLLWIYIFKSFLDGSITLMLDTYAEYSMFKFFYNNLFNGVVAIWDPFVTLGVPNIFISLSGVLSPGELLFASLHFLGINYYVSFILFILFYFILGLAGFYLLALEILEDQFCAWLAFIALLFSGMGPMLFNQIYIYFIFCPAVWVFYFLLRFSRKFEVKYFLGCIVALTNLFCFYYPFYFLTAFLFFIILLACLYPSRLTGFAKGLKIFIIQNRKIFFNCFLFVIFALLPLIFFKASLNGGDFLFLSRRDPARHIVLSPEALAKKSTSAMTFNEVSLGGTLGERMDVGKLFSHLDKYAFDCDNFFYIPVFVYIVIFVTAFVSFGRSQFLLLCLGLSIFLLSLGQVSFLHRFLFNVIFYFKYFRNFFFFMGFLIPIVILFAMFQLKRLLDPSQDHKKRLQNVIINTFLHLCFLFILYRQGNILFSTYATVVISCVSFNFLFFKPGAYKIFFLLIMILEPVQVFACYEAGSLDFKASAPGRHFKTVFYYERPALNVQKPFCFFPEQGMYGGYWYDLAMRDTKGYIANESLIVSKFTYLLSKAIDENVYLNYVHYKFYIYDRIEYSKDFFDPKIEGIFRNNKNLALVAEPPGMGMSLGKYGIPANPLVISHDTDQFKVVDFNPDRIQLMTDFNAGKFLVYTDSYEKDWKVFINDHEQKLYRANIAFKGVWLPAGRNEVVLQYSVFGPKEMYIALLFFNTLLLIYFLRSICLK